MSAFQRPRHNYIATVDPTASDDTSECYDLNSMWINTVTQAVFLCIDATQGAAVWKRVDSTVERHIEFGSDSDPYSGTKSQTFDALRSFIFEGTNHVGTPTHFKILVNHDSDTIVSQVRLYDATNGNVIATVAGLTGTEYSIVLETELDNLPEEEAVLEIQLRLSTKQANNYVHIFQFVLYWS